jgi:hypothetical protein
MLIEPSGLEIDQHNDDLVTEQVAAKGAGDRLIEDQVRMGSGSRRTRVMARDDPMMYGSLRIELCFFADRDW